MASVNSLISKHSNTSGECDQLANLLVNTPKKMFVKIKKEVPEKNQALSKKSMVPYILNTHS